MRVILASLGLLAVVLVLIASGCGNNTVSVKSTPAPMVTATSAPAPSPTPTPARVGSTVTISSGSQAIAVMLVRAIPTRWVGFLGEGGPTPGGVTFEGAGNWIVIRLYFKNTGATPYHSQVANWSWLEARMKNGQTKRVEAAGEDADFNNVYDVNANYSDAQGPANIGRLALTAGHGTYWDVAFAVGAKTKGVSFTYQGPGDIKATWVLRP
jgi:hypothetical protein